MTDFTLATDGSVEAFMRTPGPEEVIVRRGFKAGAPGVIEFSTIPVAEYLKWSGLEVVRRGE